MSIRDAIALKRINTMRTRLLRAQMRQQPPRFVPLCNCPACMAMRASGGNAVDAVFRLLGGTPADIEEPPAGGKAH